MSQDKFGEELDVARTAVCAWENERRGISEQIIVSICRAFNVNRSWLVEVAGDMFAEPRNVLDELTIQFNLSDIEKDVVKCFCELSKEQRFAIASFLTSKNKGSDNRPFVFTVRICTV